jgi:multidrug efflux system membrane fusion protein
MSTQPRIKQLTGVALLAAAGLWMAGSSVGCERPSQAAAAPQMPPPMVSVTEAIAKDVPVYLDEIGKCSAREYVAIKPQVSGRVESRSFEDGAMIKKGQVLFTIDRRPFQAALDQAKGMLAQSKAQLKFATIDFNRIKDLPRTVEPQADYDTKQSAVDVASASVQANTAAVETAQVNLDYCTIKSPIDGRAGQRLVDVGNVVNPNLPPGGTDPGSTLLVVQRMDPIYADFTINEDQLLRVRQEMAKGTLKTLVKLPEDKDYRAGELTFLDNSVQDGSGTIKLRATLPNADQHFWPGQFVNVRLVLEVAKDAVLVPTSVPQQSQKGTYALVVTEGSKSPTGMIAEMRPVKLGQRQGDLIVLESGVKAGEQVITDGQMMVQPGGPVKVLPPQATRPVQEAMAPKAADDAEKPATKPAGE